MRYWVALGCAAIIIAGGVLFAWVTKRQIESQIRSTFRQQKANGELPPELQDVNIETADIRAFSVKLPPNQEARLALAQFISTFWFIWTPVVIALCLGLAAIVGIFKRKK